MFNSSGLGLIAHAQVQGDPTHTLTLRRAYSAQMTKRFRALKGVIRKSLIDNDALALRPMSNVSPSGKSAEQIKGQFNPIPARRFDFRRSDEKIQGFMDWMDEQQRQGILEISQQQQIGRAMEDHWQNTYIRSAYQKGILRARQEMQNAGYAVPNIEDAGGINTVFNQPFHTDRVGAVYTRAFNELKGITDNMDQQISRELAEGLARGDGPEAMARRINNRVDRVGLSRARTMARTETIRAHHSATIAEYRNAGVEGVKIKAEWSTAGDSRVCPLCAPREGHVYDLDTVERLIPLHPQCRCCALPIDRTEAEGGVVQPEQPVAEPEPEDFEPVPRDQHQEFVSNIYARQAVTEDEAKSLQRYSARTDYINPALIKGEDLSENALYDKQVLEGVMDRTDLPRNIVSYRGMDLEDMPEKYKQPILESAEGEEIQLSGFQSTSLNRSFAKSYSGWSHDSVLMEVEVPGNTRGIAMVPDTNQNEILLRHNLKYEVIEHKKEVIEAGKDGKTLHTLRVRVKSATEEAVEEVDEVSLDPVASKFTNRADGEEFLRKKQEYRQWLDDSLSDEDIKGLTSKISVGMEKADEIEKFVARKFDDEFPEAWKGTKKWHSDSWTDPAVNLKLAAVDVEEPGRMIWRSSFPDDRIQDYLDHYDEMKDTVRSEFVRMRAFNQAYMERRGIESEKLYRGIGGEKGREIVSQLRREGMQRTRFPVEDVPLSGYTSDASIGRTFGSQSGGITVEIDAPRSDIIVHKDLFSGVSGKYMDEAEYILRGGKFHVNKDQIQLPSNK